VDRGPTIFLGVFLTFASAWLALVLAPYLQFSDLQPTAAEGGDEAYPQPLAGLAAQGRQVYMANGCLYCHSQQVRPKGFGADQDRGWGPRRTVARDYVYDKPILLGTMRTGPDLANIGVRRTDTDWHHKHLYYPAVTSPGSTMPPFPFLYERRQIAGEPSFAALKFTEQEVERLPPHLVAPEGHEIVPTEEARALVAYLLAQKRIHDLREAEN